MTDQVKKKVLFVCIHNSARSQMAEAFLNAMAPDRFEAQSAGLEPGKLNPVVVKAMQEAGFDISSNQTKSVQKFIDQQARFDYVITVCDESSAEACPVFPGGAARMHMGFADPSSFAGDETERLQKTRDVRDQIKAKLEEWVRESGHD